MSKGKTSGVLLLMDRFISRCDAGQIRLASEKCNLFVVSLSVCVLCFREIMMMMMMLLF